MVSIIVCGTDGKLSMHMGSVSTKISRGSSCFNKEKSNKIEY